jgi:hypothetical protein
MKMIMIPGLCSNEFQRTGGSFCESCFARFVIRGNADLPCFAAVEDDGTDEQTLVMRHGSYQESVLLTDETRERLAYGEWKGWEEWVERAERADQTPPA